MLGLKLGLELGAGSNNKISRRQVASRCSFPLKLLTNTNSYKQVQSITYFYLTSAVKDLSFTFGNYNVTGPSSTDLTGLSGVTYRLGLWDGVTTYPIYWPNGSRDGYIPAGQILTSKPVAFNGVAGQKLWLIKYAVFDAAPATFPYSQTSSNQQMNCNSVWGNALTDWTLSPGSFTQNTRATGSFDICPCIAISSSTRPPVAVAVLGDSISSDGSGDAALIAGEQGWAKRGLAYSNIPHINLGQSGLAMGHVMGPGTDLARSQRLSSLRAAGITHVLCPLSNNDWSTGTTAATLYGYFTSLKSILSGMRIKLIPCTSIPKTNAANNGQASGETQTFAQRAIFNGLIQSNNGVGYGYYDAAAIAQDSVNTDYWRTDLYAGSSTASLSIVSGIRSTSWQQKVGRCHHCPSLYKGKELGGRGLSSRATDYA